MVFTEISAPGYSLENDTRSTLKNIAFRNQLPQNSPWSGFEVVAGVFRFLRLFHQVQIESGQSLFFSYFGEAGERNELKDCSPTSQCEDAPDLGVGGILLTQTY